MNNKNSAVSAVELDGIVAEMPEIDLIVLRRIVSGITVVGECWIPSGPRNPRSHYVHLTIRNSRRLRYVHRFICHWFRGLPISKTHECHHLCWNKECCRPSHLTPLPAEEHRRQTLMDGRYLRGGAAPWAVLTDEQVMECRRRYEAGESCAALAKEMEVNRSALWSAIHGESFAHLPGAIKPNNRRDARGSRHKRARLMEADIPEIYMAYWTGEANTVELASRYGVSDETIRGVVHGKSWTHVERPAVERKRVRIGTRRYRIERDGN
jgi:hypothetical protein